MKRELANELLSTVMDWKSADVEEYRERLEDLAELKYDYYQQYRAGGRFLENLVVWLNNFQKQSERKIALEFVLNNLVFISPNEINHLVGMVFADNIVPKLKKQSRRIQKEKQLKFSDMQKTELLTLLKKQSLFLGLSDGSKIDVFRRSNPELDHEQIRLSYEIPDSKYDDIINAINESVKTMKLTGDLDVIAKSSPIKNIFLLDDFSASGISFIRREERKDKKTVEWKGKISHLIRSLADNGFDLSNTNLSVILYIATDKALTRIKEGLSKYKNEDSQFNPEFDVAAMQIVEAYVPSNEEEKIFEKYFDEAIIDSHYRKGKIDKPYLGFDECSLPIVLYHNTPNNTFPIIWSTQQALFPRITRHKDV